MPLFVHVFATNIGIVVLLVKKQSSIFLNTSIANLLVNMETRV